MSVEKNYKIAFKGLKPGVYTYDFEVDSSFFEAFESTEIKGGDCTVRVELRRLETMLDMAVEVVGKVTTLCDRCLEDCEIPIAYEGNLVVKFSSEEQEYDGEVMWLTPADDEVDLAQYIYESVVLSLPYQRIHPEGECNPEMMSRFTTISTEELDRMEAEAEASNLSQENRAQLEALKRQLEQR